MMYKIRHPILYRRVRRGMKLLDRKNPGWKKHVNKKIDMMNIHSCILGQVYGEYSEGAIKVGLLFCEDKSFGFSCPYRDEDTLAKIWRKEIDKDV